MVLEIVDIIIHTVMKNPLTIFGKIEMETLDGTIRSILLSLKI